MSLNASLFSMLLGAALLLLYSGLLLAPAPLLRGLRAFPRSVFPARLLTAVCLVWFAQNLWQVDLGAFNPAKRALFVVVPVGWYLITTYLPDLLAVRGLCALLLLAGRPLLVMTRWQEGPASIAVGLLIYAVMIKSMFLVVYPHLWLRGLNWLEARPLRLRAAASVGLALGAALLVCGLLSR
jgi:hypothetical protein